MKAAHCGYKDVVNMLLMGGADPMKKNYVSFFE